MRRGCSRLGSIKIVMLRLSEDLWLRWKVRLRKAEIESGSSGLRFSVHVVPAFHQS